MSLIRRNSDRAWGTCVSPPEATRRSFVGVFARSAKFFFLDHQQNFFKTQNPGGGAEPNCPEKKIHLSSPLYFTLPTPFFPQCLRPRGVCTINFTPFFFSSTLFFFLVPAQLLNADFTVYSIRRGVFVCPVFVPKPFPFSFLLTVILGFQVLGRSAASGIRLEVLYRLSFLEATVFIIRGSHRVRVFVFTGFGRAIQGGEALLLCFDKSGRGQSSKKNKKGQNLGFGTPW